MGRPYREQPSACRFSVGALVAPILVVQTPLFSARQASTVSVQTMLPSPHGPQLAGSVFGPHPTMPRAMATAPMRRVMLGRGYTAGMARPKSARRASDAGSAFRRFSADEYAVIRAAMDRQTKGVIGGATITTAAFWREIILREARRIADGK